MASGIHQVLVNRINQLCKQRKWSMYRLSIESGISYNTIKSILKRNTSNTYLVTVKMIADAFDMDIATFFDTPEFRALEQEIQ